MHHTFAVEAIDKLLQVRFRHLIEGRDKSYPKPRVQCPQQGAASCSEQLCYYWESCQKDYMTKSLHTRML